MKDINTIINIANKKLDAARLLVNSDLYDDAYYLAGYAFELYLKARICKHFDIEDLFDFDNVKKRSLPFPPTLKTKEQDNLYKPFKVHDYIHLIILGGLFNIFQDECEMNVKIKGAWSVIATWNENCRYICGKNQKEVSIFIDCIEESIKWLQKHI